jgi:WD40 repeat protein
VQGIALRAKDSPSAGYDAFISYSHAIKGELAAALQWWLERFATPWYRPRGLRIFRDYTSLSAGADLGRTIEEALASSSWLILLASPEAARSRWVNREVAWWRKHKTAERVCVVLTGGRLRWSDEDGDWDWGVTNALPSEAKGMFVREPLWVDLSSIQTPTDLDRSNPVLLNSVAQIAAPLRGVDKDSLVGKHITLHRRARRQRRGGLAGLVLLTVAALVAAFVAVLQANNASRQRREAELQRDLATARQLTVQAESIRSADIVTAIRLGVAAVAISEDARVRTSLGLTLAQGRSVSPDGVYGPIADLAFSPDGRTIATGSHEDTVVLRDVSETGRSLRIAVLPGHGDDVNAVAFSPDGRTLASASGDTTAKLWDVTDPGRAAPVATLAGHQARVVDIAFSADGDTLVTASEDATIGLWDISDRGRPVRTGTIDNEVGFVDAVALSPDGRILATGSQEQPYLGLGGTAELWDVSDRRELRRIGVLRGHGNRVVDVAFSPDSGTLVTVSKDGTAKLWDTHDLVAPEPTATLRGHTHEVLTVEFSPDGRTVATGGHDRSVRLWDVSDRRQPKAIGALPGHPDFVLAVAFGPDGRKLASATINAFRMWDMSPLSAIASDPIAEACRVVGHGLTPDEWLAQAPGLPYRQTCPA